MVEYNLDIIFSGGVEVWGGCAQWLAHVELLEENPPDDDCYCSLKWMKFSWSVDALTVVCTSQTDISQQPRCCNTWWMPTGLSRFSFCQAGSQSSSAPSLVCVIWDQMQRANWQRELEGWSSVKVTRSCLSSDCSSEKRGKWSVCFLCMLFSVLRDPFQFYLWVFSLFSEREMMGGPKKL